MDGEKQEGAIPPRRKSSSSKPELELSPPKAKMPRISREQFMTCIAQQQEQIRQLEEELKEFRKKGATPRITKFPRRVLMLSPIPPTETPASTMKLIADSDTCSAHLCVLAKSCEADLVIDTLKWVAEDQSAPVPSVSSVLTACQTFQERQDIIQLGLRVLTRVDKCNWPKESTVSSALSKFLTLYPEPLLAYYSLCCIERYEIQKNYRNDNVLRQCALILHNSTLENSYQQQTIPYTVILLKRVAIQVRNEQALCIAEGIEKKLQVL